MKQYPEVCYEIFVRSFCDSNGDGIGDLNGITSRLDYISGLGVRGIWLTPIHPSPSYHKYDVADYYSIDPEYGTMEDYRNLLEQAHRRGIRVYMDLVMHHSSVLHPWFLNAKCNPQSDYRHYYRWMSDDRISEMGVEVRELTHDAHTVNPWHKVKGDKERFLGIFSREMADLNFDHERLKNEMFKVAAFWLNEVGVDGFRLDAARHIYPVWEDGRNSPFWEEFGQQIERIKPETYLVGEVWAETERVAPFFRGLKANFNFDLCRKIEEVVVTGQNQDLVLWLQSQRRIFEGVSPAYIDAIMLSNHDQQRIGSTVKGDSARMKLAAAILLTLPGQPYLYYGEELGMLGRKPDQFLREPFLWVNNPEETTWIKPKYSTPSRVPSLQEALGDPFSLFYCYQNLIRLRTSSSALGAVQYTGISESGIEEEPHILSYIRQDGHSAFLVIHNLQKTEQNLTLPEHLANFSVVRYATTARFFKRHLNLMLGSCNSIILERQSEDGSFILSENR